MPLYEFRCSNCDAVEGIVCRMSDDIPETLPCKCTGEKHRIYGFHTPQERYYKPLISDSLAMNPDQIAEHRRMFPDIKVHPDGRPEFTGFKQHDEYLEKTGFHKIKQKKRRKLKKISLKSCKKDM